MSMYLKLVYEMRTLFLHPRWRRDCQFTSTLAEGLASRLQGGKEISFIFQLV